MSLPATSLLPLRVFFFGKVKPHGVAKKRFFSTFKKPILSSPKEKTSLQKLFYSTRKIEEPTYTPQEQEILKLMQQGNIKGALPKITSLIDEAKSKEGEWSAQTLRLQQLTARCYAQLNDLQNLKPVLENIASFNDHHDRTDAYFNNASFEALDNLAVYYEKMGNFTDAILALSKMNKMCAYKSQFIYSMIQLAPPRVLEGVDDGTLHMLMSAKDLVLQYFHKDHWLLGYNFNAIGKFYFHVQRLNKAKEYFDLALPILEHNLSTSQSTLKSRLEFAIADLYSNLGSVHVQMPIKQQQQTETKPSFFLQKSLKSFEKDFDKDSLRIAYTLSFLASAYLSEDRNEDAEALFGRLNQIYTIQKYPKNSSLYVFFRQSEVELLNRLKKTKDAEKVQEEIKKYPEPKPFLVYDPSLVKFIF